MSLRSAPPDYGRHRPCAFRGSFLLHAWQITCRNLFTSSPVLLSGSSHYTSPSLHLFSMQVLFVFQAGVPRKHRSKGHGHPRRSVDTSSCSRSSRPRWPKPSKSVLSSCSQTGVPLAHTTRLRKPRAPKPSVAQSSHTPNAHPPQTLHYLRCFAGMYFFRQELGHPRQSTDTCPSSRSSRPRWPKPPKSVLSSCSQTGVPLAHTTRLRKPRAPKPSVAQSSHTPNAHPPQTLHYLRCFAGMYFFRQELGHPRQSTDTCPSSRSSRPRWPKPPKPMFLNTPRGYGHQRPHAFCGSFLVRSKQTSCHSSQFFDLQAGIWSGRNLNIPACRQTPVPAAGVPALDGPNLPSRCLWSTPRAYGRHMPHTSCGSFLISFQADHLPQ